MDVVNFAAAGPKPCEIVLVRRADQLTVTFLGSLTEMAARVLDEVLDRSVRDRTRKVVVDLSAAI